MPMRMYTSIFCSVSTHRTQVATAYLQDFQHSINISAAKKKGSQRSEVVLEMGDKKLPRYPKGKHLHLPCQKQA